jgi:hypothetical protein
VKNLFLKYTFYVRYSVGHNFIFFIIATFAIIKPKTTLKMFPVFMNYLRCSVLCLACSGSLPKENICPAAMLLFYTLLKYFLNKHCTFAQGLLPYIILYNRVLGAIVTPTPPPPSQQFRASVILLFYTVWRSRFFQWRNVHVSVS